MSLASSPSLGGQSDTGFEAGAGQTNGHQHGKQPARLLAKKVSKKEGVRKGNKRDEQAAVRGRIPVSTEPLDSSNLTRVAAHCNERKTCAKACSVSNL